MKKKLKALLQGKEPLDNADLQRLKKSFEVAKVKVAKAKTAKEEARTALVKAAEQWLSQSAIPHAPVEKRKKKEPKTAKTKDAPRNKSDKVALK